jgi:hypothetical protein
MSALTVLPNGEILLHILPTKKTKAQFIVGSRAEAIEKYREWINTQPLLLESLKELIGKTLGCWCCPQDCHGIILLDLIQEIFGGERIDKFTLAMK